MGWACRYDWEEKKYVKNFGGELLGKKLI